MDLAHLPAFAQVDMSLADPPTTSVVLAAANWAQGTLTGTLSTIIAMVAVASIGLMMLAGRLDTRRGLIVLLGCFILFGASAIANGLRSAADSVGISPPSADASMQAKPPIEPPSHEKAKNYDPYAGAAVPQ